MNKIIILTVILCAAAFCATAQTLRIRSNSLENLNIICVGSDDAGHQVTKALYDVSYDYWKTISIYNVKYGYDKYNNDEMQHTAADSSLRWKMLIIYNNSTLQKDTLNITERTRNIHLDYAKVKARVSLSYERKYLITDVVIKDEE